MIALEDEKIEERLRPFRELMLNSESLLDVKERELRKSHDRYDRIYVCRFLDGMSIRAISNNLSFSKTEVHRTIQSILKTIRRKI